MCMWEAVMSRQFVGKMVFDKDDSMAMRYVRTCILHLQEEELCFSCGPVSCRFLFLRVMLDRMTG